MTTLAELIRDNFDADPDCTTRAVFAAAGVPAKWCDFFYAVTRDECRRQSRHLVRLHERGVDPDDIVSPTAKGRPITKPVTPWVNVNDRTVYLADRMYTGECYVLKGDATVNQWMQRATFLAHLRDGVSRTIDDCELIAKHLVDQGANTLNDLVAVAA